MAFLALFIFKRRIGFLALVFVIVLTHVLGKMNENVFNSMGGLGKKEVECIVGCRQMAIHAVGYKSLGVVYMGGSFPGFHGKLNFVAGGAKLGRGSADHRLIGNTEKRKGDQNADRNQDQSFEIFFHEYPFGINPEKNSLFLCHIVLRLRLFNTTFLKKKTFF